MSKFDRDGYMGEAFHTWLEWLEKSESMIKKGVVKKVPEGQVFHPDHFILPATDEGKMRMAGTFLMLDYDLAPKVRSAVKYRVKLSVMKTIVANYADEMEELLENVPVNLPHPDCVLVVEDDGADGDSMDTVLCISEETPRDGKDYPELGVEAGGIFHCVNLVFYSKEGLPVPAGTNANRNLCHIPAEIHFRKGSLFDEATPLFAIMDEVKPRERAEDMMRMVWSMVTAWMYTMHLSGYLNQNRQVGVPPAAKNFRPSKMRKKSAQPKFEHTLMELPVDRVAGDPTGRTHAGGKHRDHPVRGHMRTYKSGKTVFVRAHRRGDASLGSVSHEYDLGLHGQTTRTVEPEPDYLTTEDILRLVA